MDQEVHDRTETDFGATAETPAAPGFSSTYTFPVPPLPPPPHSHTIVGTTSVIPLVRSFRFVHEPVQRDSADRFIGRGNELKAFVERVLFSNGGSFLVTGYRGVGKTSFINQALNRLEEVIRSAEADFGRPMRIVTIGLNIARPVQPAELMHYIVRRLYDRLVEMEIYPLLDRTTREALKEAYDRTSFNMARTMSEATEKSIGISDAGLSSKLLGMTAKLSAGAKRTSTHNYEMTFLGYDDRAAEHDIITISRRLREGYVARRSRWERLRRWLAGDANGAAVRTELKIVFVFDELDKLEEFTLTSGNEKKPVIDEILGALKNLFTTSGVTFVFVAGKDLQERWLEDVGKGDSVYESVFSYDKYLPCMWTDTAAICDHLVETDAPAGREAFELFKSFLSYKGRGIPRRIVRTFNEYVSWHHNEPALHFTREQLGRIRFFARLQDALEDNKGILFGEAREESAGTQSDKRRLGVYYLVDWMMRQSGEFTLSDVVSASKRLSAKIALADEIAPRVIEDVIQTLLNKEYLQEAQPKLDKVVIGAPNVPGERRYFIPPRRVIEMGGNADELEEDSRLLSAIGQPGEGAASLTSIGKFRILETIGSGGMGIVYRATDSALGRIVAIKTMQRQLVGDSSVRERFKREAGILSHLSHPNIVTFLDAGVENDRAYIVMEYLEGLTLEQVIATLGKLSVELAVTVMRRVTSALEYMHQRSIVRNDLKPANVMLTTTGRLCLLDFGISKLAQNMNADLTGTGQFVGTPRYMSPEQFEGRTTVDGRSDIYSLGVVLYRMLTRVYPVDGENPFDIFIALRSAKRVPPSTYANVSAAIDAVVLRCLAVDPAARYATIGEFMTALNTAAGEPADVDLRQLVAETRERAQSLNEWGSESTQEKPIEEALSVPASQPAVVPRRASSDTGARPAPVPVPAGPAPRGDQGAFCVNCGTKSDDASQVFCLNCGARLDQAPAVDRTMTSTSPGVSALPRVSPLQTAHRVESSLIPVGDTFLLRPRETTFGRVPQNDIVILSPAVSRYHGRFVMSPDGCTVEDYGSSNGSQVNGERVAERRLLANGDLVQIGDVQFRFKA